MYIRMVSAEELKTAPIARLRELGRIVGVPSPTSMPKNKLINYIVKLFYGDYRVKVEYYRGPLEFKEDLTSYLISRDDPDFDVNNVVYIDENCFDKKMELIDDIDKAEALKRKAIAAEEKAKAEELALNEAQKNGEIVDDGELSESDYVSLEPTPFHGFDDIIFEDSGASSDAYMEGVFEQHSSGYGFIRNGAYNAKYKDAYVSPLTIKKYNLISGDEVIATYKKVKEEDSPAVVEVLKVNGVRAATYMNRTAFEELVPYYPTVRLALDYFAELNDAATRCIDLICPIGLGQRGLIVAPPKTGKTTLLKKLAQGIERNHGSSVKLFVLLIGERPEEVTDFVRSLKCEVVYSTFDEDAEKHINAANCVLAKAKRIVEGGGHSIILMDSLTRLVRAYNNGKESSGKILSGGLDPLALVEPKRFFGSARNIEDGGSLTIISTVLVETGSRMDDVIYEEFKGTGNMEIQLSRRLSERRIFPAIDILKSGTRKEELLFKEAEFARICKLREFLVECQEPTKVLLEMVKKTSNNSEILNRLDMLIKLYHGNNEGKA